MKQTVINGTVIVKTKFKTVENNLLKVLHVVEAVRSGHSIGIRYFNTEKAANEFYSIIVNIAEKKNGNITSRDFH